MKGFKMTPTLEPCPLCGGKAKVKRQRFFCDSVTYYAWCQNADCRLREGFCIIRQTRWQAIKEWNNLGKEKE
jgi:hypothetical protein